jgi:hypothetical protein
MQLPTKQKRCRKGRVWDSESARIRLVAEEMKTTGAACLFPVVSGVLIPPAKIFVKFGANRLNCWLRILNEFARLPLVLALFSSN